MWRDRYRFPGTNNRAIACGSPASGHELGDPVMHLPAVTCSACLLSLDILLENGWAKVEPWNNGLCVEVDIQVFPYAPSPLGSIFGIDPATYELWRGAAITSTAVDATDDWFRAKYRDLFAAVAQ